MKILSIEMFGYKHIRRLTNIQRIKVDFTEKIQLVLGSNGSGKSSMLRELSPLPASPADYSKDGYKIIILLKDNKKYILKSEFGGKPRHSFIVDGVNLNAGDGTAQIQKDLVKRHFGITPEIHSLMLGETKFHSMSIADRRYWFTQLSDTSYTFALAMYQKLKEALRDTTGAIKMAQTRLAQETQKLLSKEEEQKYKVQVKELTEFLHYLLAQTSPKVYNVDQLKQAARNDLRQMGTLAAQVKATYAFVTGGAVTESELQDSVNKLSGVVYGLEHQVHQLSEYLVQEQDLAKQIQDTGMHDVAELNNRLLELSRDESKIRSNIRLSIEWKGESARDCKRLLQSVLPILTELIAQLPEDPDKRMTYERQNYLAEYCKQAAAGLQTLNKQQIATILRKTDLERLKSAHLTECPNCRHAWIQGFNEAEYLELCAMASRTGEAIDKQDKDLVEKQKALAEVTSYLDTRSQLLSIIRHNPTLSPIWAEVLDSNLLNTSPKLVVNMLNTVLVDLDEFIKIDEITKEAKDLIELKKRITGNSEQNFDKLKVKAQQLESKLFTVQTELSAKRSLLKDQAKTLEQIKTLKEKAQMLETVLARTNEIGKDLIEAQRTQAIKQIIQIVQTELTRKEQALSQMQVQYAIVADLEKQVKLYEEQASVLKVMVRGMSPTEGLIAKSLLGFINNFVNQVNSFIRKIWLYPLELVPILPSENNHVDLDYKFALKAGDHSDDHVPDVSKGSTAMREVVDLAFRVVAMQYLGLQECPLLLDEFAASFDAAHRQAAYHTISNVIAQSNFSQLFIVSHYEQTYGSMTNSEITVLCPNNVNLPRDSVFNKHVSIS